MNFAGIDFSLTAAGLAVIQDPDNPSNAMVQTVIPGKRSGQHRVAYLADTITHVLNPFRPCLVAFEGGSFDHRRPGTNVRVEAIGVIKHHLWMAGIWHAHRHASRIERNTVNPFVDVPPTTIQKYVTGYGGGKREEKKRAMIAAVEAMGARVLEDNQADAFGLALMLRDTWRFVTEGVKPETLYRYEQVDKLSGWMRQLLAKGVTA